MNKKADNGAILEKSICEVKLQMKEVFQ